jgi:ArsR family transcriptional regulator
VLTDRQCFGILKSMKTALPLVAEETRPLEVTERHVDAFTALAHPSRLRVFFFLAQSRREVSAGDIQAAVGIPAPTLSHHLGLLRRAGLVQSRREERHVYYAVRPDRVSELVRLLTDCC